MTEYYELTLEFKANKHQKEFLNDRTSKLLHLSTGFGGGKTFALCYKLLELSYLNKGMHGGLVVPDFKDFKRDILPEMEQILDANGIKHRFHGSEHWFQFPWSSGRLYVASGEKKLRGPNWAYAGINEVTLIPLIRYKEVIGRVRVKEAKFPQIASVGTPEGFASEYYEYFIENPPPNLRMLYGSTDDNAENLHGDYLENLENAYDSRMIDAYRRGLWINMSGNRFYYSYDPAKNDDANIKANDQAMFCVAMDFNVDPFCASVWQTDGHNLYAIDEIKLAGGEGYDTKKMITALMARGYTPQTAVIYPDPAGRARSTKGAPDITVLRQAGYRVEVKTVAPSFRKRQLNVNNLLDKGRIKINPFKCKSLKKDFMAVEQDVVTLEKKKDNPALTHFSDGVDYMCDIMFPFSGDQKAVRQERIR